MEPESESRRGADDGAAPRPDVEEAPQRSSLRQLTVRASVFTVFGMAGRNALRLLNNVILARLLFPEAFGVMALVNIFVFAMQLFTDIGIGPGIIQTPMFEHDVPKQIRDQLASKIPLQRLGVPLDMANAILFFVSDESAYITGQSIFVCGGSPVTILFKNKRCCRQIKGRSGRRIVDQ